MEVLLTVAVILTVLAIITQAAVLVSLYLLSRRISGKAEVLMNESKRFIAPLDSITNNLKTVSDHLAETGKIAHGQALQVQSMMNETHENIRTQISDVRDTVMDTVHEARSILMRPVREYSAIANAIAQGVRTFFSGRKPEPAKGESEIIIVPEERPAA
jgi:hypothetical protein